MERCAACHYYDRHNGKVNDGMSVQAGQCRRTAPHLSPLNAKTYMIEGIWPTVRDDDWCGEWKALVRRVDPSRISEVLNANSSGPRVTEEQPRATVISATPVQPRPRPVARIREPLTGGNAPDDAVSTLSFGPIRGD